MKVVLVDPKGVWEGLNNGLASIAANIRNSCDVKVVDFVNYSKGTPDERLAIAKDADIVGISMKSFTLLESIMVAKKVREINPGAKIVAGGPHVIVDGYNLLKENDVFDLGVVGEAEFIFQDIVSGKNPSGIEGIIYRDGADLKQNPMKGWIPNLDKLPFPCYDDFDSVSHSGKIQPIDVWPLVTSRGCPYTCTYCLKENALIHTENGIMKIKDVKIGVKVLSHSGKFMPVKQFFTRPYTGKMVKIKVKKMPVVEATLGHKFHVLRNGIKLELPAEEIKKGDFLTVKLPETKIIEYIDVKQIIGEKTLVYEYERKVPYEKIKMAIELHNGGLSTRQIAAKTGLSKSFVHTAINSKFEEKKKIENKLNEKDGKISFRLSEGIPAKLPITKGLCRLFGYYLAEGSITKHAQRPNSYEIVWSFRKDERAYIDDVKTIVKDELGLDSFIITQDNVTRVCISNAPLAALLKNLFGKGSDKKFICELILSLKTEFLEELMKGWILGDGGIVSYNGKKMIKATTVSDSLAYQFFIIAQKIGLSPSLQKNIVKNHEFNGRIIKSCGYNYHLNFKSKKDVKQLLNSIFGLEMELGKELGTVELRDTDAVYLPVDRMELEDFSGTVYNIEVEDDHTYTANGFLVNNCNVPVVIGRKFRTRSKENILEELRWAQEHYKSKEFKVLDDNFTLLMDRAKEMCKYFIDEGMDMKWTCPNGIRADRLDEELCNLMKKAGCYSMSIYIESGDPDVFDKIRKGEKLADVEKGIKFAQKAGIKVHGFFIIGLVGSTYESDKRSMEFAKRMGISASWGILVPYPGTEVWEQVKADPNTRMLRDWKEGFHIVARPKPVFDTPQYTAEERVKAYYLANMSTIKKKDIPRAAKMVVKGLIAGK